MSVNDGYIFSAHYFDCQDYSFTVLVHVSSNFHKYPTFNDLYEYHNINIDNI